jgi:hypothetical protein
VGQELPAAASSAAFTKRSQIERTSTQDHRP